MPISPAKPSTAPIATPAQTAAFITRWQGVTASGTVYRAKFCHRPVRPAGRGQAPPHAHAGLHVRAAHHLPAWRWQHQRWAHRLLQARPLCAGSEKAPGRQPHPKVFGNGLLQARSQAEDYARALPAQEGRPPFVLVVDVGTVIEVYAEFSRTGGTYTPFPDPRSHRIALADLAKPEVLERLHRIWTQPDSLNPARISAQVTREVAQLLARLAKSLESSLQATIRRKSASRPRQSSASSS